jgi:hypothetical protein
VTSRTRVRLTVLSMGAMLVVASGCGVTPEAQPHKLASSPAVTVAPPEGRVTRLSAIFLVRGNALMAVHRAVPVPASVHQTVQALLSGPTTAEAGQGFRSALPGGVQVTQLSLQDSTATVDLTEGLSAVSSQEQGLALAQLVYTVTATPGISRLRVLVEGKPVEVPRADGTLTSDALTRTDYQALLVR